MISDFLPFVTYVILRGRAIVVRRVAGLQVSVEQVRRRVVNSLGPDDRGAFLGNVVCVRNTPSGMLNLNRRR